MAKFGFDLGDYETQGDFETMPPGVYKMMCIEAEIKNTRDGNGKLIAATFEVLEPAKFKGRRVWQNFNIVNASERAEQIGREQLKSWATACGKPNARDTDELVDKVFSANLAIEKGTGVYSDKNIIKSYILPKKGGNGASKFEDDDDAPAPAPAKASKKEKAEEEPAPAPRPRPSSSKNTPWED